MPRFRLVVPALLLALASACPARADWPAGGAVVLGLPPGLTHPRPISYEAVEDGAGGLFTVWQAGALQRIGPGGTAAPGWPAAGRPVHALEGPPRMIGDDAGGVYVCASGDPVRISRIGASGATAAGWPEQGIEISALATTTRGPLLARDGAGGAFVAWWEQPVGEAGRIVVQRVGADGSTATPSPLVVVPSAFDTEPVGLVADGAGGAFLAYSTSYATPEADLHAQHVSHELQALWPGAGVAISTHGGAQMNPVMTPDGIGGLYVAWGDARDDPTYPYDLRVFVTRLDAGGARAAGWPPTGLPAGLGSTGMSLSPQLLRNDDGTIFVGWRSVTGGPVAYVQKIRPEGVCAAGWPAAGIPISPTLNPAANATSLEDFAVESAPGGANGMPGFGMVPDGAGGVYAAWIEDSRVTVQRVDANGAGRPGWDPAGVTVATPRADGHHFWHPDAPGVVTDGLGGAIVTWREMAYVPMHEWYEEIRAAHVTSGGAVLGVGDGVVAAPALALAPNPSTGTFRAAVTLADASPARLDLFDLQGRRLESHALAGAGRHVVGFGVRTRLPSGVYVARLVTATRTLIARAAVVR